MAGIGIVEPTLARTYANEPVAPIPAIRRATVLRLQLSLNGHPLLVAISHRS
jgi:hypothetical protein